MKRNLKRKIQIAREVKAAGGTSLDLDTLNGWRVRVSSLGDVKTRHFTKLDRKTAKAIERACR